MPNYIIQGGDTLSGIAQKNKKTVADLLKANPNIKDPNRIISGASLNIPDSAQTDQNATTLSASSSPIKEAITPKTPKDLFVQKVIDYFNSKDNQTTDNTKINDLQTAQSGYTQQINETLDLLNKLRPNLKTRTGDYIVPEAARARIEASERTPLTQSLQTLQQGKTGILEQLSNEQKAQSELNKKPLEDLKALSDIFGTYEKATAPEKIDTSIVEVNGRKILVDSQTGKTVRDLGPITQKTKSTETGKITTADIKSTIDQALSDNKAFGPDGKISWESYLWMLQNWVNNGGTKANFDINYPISQYLDEGNQNEFNKRLSQ